MPSRPTELVFPLRGINEGWGFGKQPEGTTPDAQNVTPFDPLDDRIRGGQRGGTSKYYSALHNGSAIIQRMGTVTDMLNPGSTGTDTFTQANGQLSGTDWYLLEQAAGLTFIASATVPLIVSNEVSRSQPGTPVAYRTGGLHKSLAIISSNYSISADITLDATVSGTQPRMEFLVRVATPGFPLSYSDDMLPIWIEIWRTPSDIYSLVVNSLHTDGRDIHLTMTPGSNDYLDPAWWASTPRTVKLVAEGNDFSMYVGSTLLTTMTIPQHGNTGTGIGFFLLCATANDNASTVTLDNFIFTDDPSQSGREHKMVAVSGGDIYQGILPLILTLATSGTNAVATSGRIDMQTAFDKIYFADGNPANYKYFDNNDDIVYTWTPTAGTLPMGSDETAVTITAATPGTPSFTVAEDWSDRAAGDYLLVADSVSNDGFYTIASVSGSGPTVLTVNEVIPDNDVTGSPTIQYQNRGCRIIKLYRGRVLMAGLVTDPQNWFMPVAGNPLDWDYGATPISATMAVAGNNTDSGKCPDIITCLAPYSDDIMFIGGDHTLWMLRGDPAEKGRIDNISYQTGIAGPDAYTFDPNGIFYFFGAGTLWRMAIGGVPEPLSRNRMDSTFGAISLVTNTIHLAWDNARHGLFIFVVPSVEGSTTHYYWDERTDSFWKLVFPDAQGPTTVFAFDGDNPNDNALMLGGWDGYIRQIDSSATDDDGTAISSYVLYAPISVGGPTVNTRISSITAVLDTDSDDVILTVYAEDTVQKTIEASTIRFARTIAAGRTKMLGRIAGNAIMIKLSNSVDETTWAVESILVDVKAVGHTRKDQL